MDKPISDIAFSPAVKQWQQAKGSRHAHARRDFSNKLFPQLVRFIEQRDSFYLASASAEGQPYIQHRGGPKGFLKVMDERTLAFADFAGNRQFVSAGNLSENNKVYLFLMDYVNRNRLKIWGEATVIEDDATLMLSLIHI